MVNKKLEPEQVWAYFLNHEKDYGSTMELIASNDEFGVNIYLTADHGMAQVVVEIDGVDSVEEYMADYVDCVSTMSEVYNTYLYDFVNEVAKSDCATDSASSIEEDREEEIEIREDSLFDAAFDFLEVVLEGSIKYSDATINAMVEDCKDHFVEYIARKFGKNVYRPMYLVDENGESFYTENPYPQMIFDDEDNPIYAGSSVSK